jgi:2-desacetyl-2-hydroxyethyl bacteriochlorophyllide A dehydrogenase
MRAVTFQGVERVVCETVADPAIERPTDVVVEIELAGICGSDLHPYHGREVGIEAGTVMGHEYVGRVVEAGSGVERLAPGDRVVGPFTTCCGACFYCRTGLTCRCAAGQLFGWREGGAGLHGAQAELMRVPLADATLVVVDESLDATEVLFVGDILATGFYSAELGGVGPGSVVAVVGCGPVGLMAVLGARELGAERVFALDRVAERLELARRFGAEPLDVSHLDAVALLREATGGRGADAVLEAVGSPGATRAAIDLLRPGGTLAAVGVHTEPAFAFAPGEAYDKNLTYRAGRCPARRYAERLLDLVARGTYDLRSLVSHRLALEQGPAGYQMFAERRDGCTKVVLVP